MFTGGISIGKYFCFPAGLVARLDAMADMPVSISIDPDNLNNTNERCRDKSSDALYVNTPGVCAISDSFKQPIVNSGFELARAPLLSG